MPRRLTVTLPDDLSEMIETFSKQTGLCASDVVRLCLNIKLEELLKTVIKN